MTTFKYIKFYFLLFVLVSSLTSFGQPLDTNKPLYQDDSIRLKSAINFLKIKIGPQFTDSLKFSGAFQNILYVLTFDIISKVNKSYKNTIPIFFDNFKIDTTYNTKIDSADLISFFSGKPTKHLIINKLRAIELVKQSDLTKGIKPWEIKLEDVVDKLSWNISSYTDDKKGIGLKINAWSEKQSYYSWLLTH